MRLYTSELVKKYKARTVVNHVSIDVNQGEIVGLLGPNGAGKTTTFYMIVGLIKPNEGQIFLEDDIGIQLSGGERRRTEIARAVAINPAFILLDEPFAGVDPIAVEDIQSIVATLKNKNIGVIITDHNVDETLAITDRTYLLFEGKILKAGSAEELAADPMVRKVYLGQHFELRRSPTLDKLRKGQPASAAEENPSEEK